MRRTFIGARVSIGLTFGIVATMAAAAPSQAQNATSAGSPAPKSDSSAYAGAWNARSNNPAYRGALLLHIELQQRGDTLIGTIVLQQQGLASESPVDLVGTLSDGHVKLADRRRAVLLDGVLRDGKLVARVVPGQANQVSAFQTIFTKEP